MYGFDVSSLISVAQGSISWSKHFTIIKDAQCGFMYTVHLAVEYGVTGAPAPSVTDHLVVIEEGQVLHCNAMLSGAYWLEHPVRCTIKDSLGNVVFTKTKWLRAGIALWTDFFRNESLPKGSYTVEWSVCGKQGGHYLTVSAAPPGFTTNDIDIEIVVTDTSGINAYNAWHVIKESVRAEMLIHNTTVKLKSAETKGKYLVIFHLEVTAPPEEGIGSIGIEPLSTAIILLLIVSIVYFLVAVPAIEQRRIAQLAYNTTFHKYTYEECANMTWTEWTACMAATYPDVWDNIKDKIEAPKPPAPPPDWITYIMYIVLAVGAMAGIFIFVKYVMPALKVKR